MVFLNQTSEDSNENISHLLCLVLTDIWLTINSTYWKWIIR